MSKTNFQSSLAHLGDKTLLIIGGRNMSEELTKKSTTELVGVLQAISVVASDMAGRLMKLQRGLECREAESGLCGKSCQRQPTAKSC